MKKQRSISSLKGLADNVFSKYIRTRDNFTCFTCDKFGDMKSMQCGHYISRSINILRYDEKNCNAQCVGCNVFKSGNIPEYAIRLIRKYGNTILEELHARKQELHQFTHQELEAIIQKYSPSDLSTKNLHGLQ